MKTNLDIINDILEEKQQLLREYKASLREQSTQQLFDACNAAGIKPGSSKTSALYALFLVKRRELGIDELQARKYDIEESMSS
jgi:hypothetical protein